MRKVLDKYCWNCGYLFPGQRTGKCPNCDSGTAISQGKLFRLHPEDIKYFNKLHENGGMLKRLYWPSEKPSYEGIDVESASDDGTNVTIYALGVLITFIDSRKGPVEFNRQRVGTRTPDPAETVLPRTVINLARNLAAVKMRQQKITYHQNQLYLKARKTIQPPIAIGQH